MTKVSILVPAFNRPDLLRRTLDSIMAQDFDDYEVVITDDSPADLVERVVREHPLHKRIRYERNPQRLGPALNWNRAACLASGEYIKYLHHDDCFASPRALRVFCRALDEHLDAGMAFCASRHVDPVGKLLDSYWPPQECLDALTSDFKAALLEKNVVGAPSAVIYRRNIHRPFEAELKWLIDVDFYIALLNQNPRFVFIPELLVHVTSDDLTSGSARLTNQCVGVLDVEVREAYYVWKKWRGCQPLDARSFAEMTARLMWRSPRLELGRLNAEERDFLLQLLYRDYFILSHRRKPDGPRWRNFFRSSYDLTPDWFKFMLRAMRHRGRMLS